MKLSTAMMLGDSLRERTNEIYLDQKKDGTYCGCAVGGALLALGRGRVIGEFNDIRFVIFPWLRT